MAASRPWEVIVAPVMASIWLSARVPSAPFTIWKTLVVGQRAFGTLHDLEDRGLVEGSLLADERGLEGRIVLDLGAEAGGFGLVVEIGTLDLCAAFLEGDIAPDRAPEAGAVDGNHGGAVLEDEHGPQRPAP